MRTLAGTQAKRILVGLMSEPSLAVDVRAALTEIIGDLGLKQCLPVVRRQLEHDAGIIRYWSCQTLGMMGGPDDLPALGTLRADREPGHFGETVADAAGWAISMISRDDER